MSTLTLNDISRVNVVDDNEESRTSFGYTVEDAELDPLPANGPLGTLDDFISNAAPAQAVLSDFELRAKNYAKFTGAQLVSRVVMSGLPAVLCTKFEKAQVQLIRPYRRWIPVLLKPEELTPDSLVRGFETCIAEMKQEFKPDRRPWRSLVRFTEPDPDTDLNYFIEVPAWDSQERLRITLTDIPLAIRQLVQPDFRCHIESNLGATSFEDIYLSNWSIP